MDTCKWVSYAYCFILSTSEEIAFFSQKFMEEDIIIIIDRKSLNTDTLCTSNESKHQLLFLFLFVILSAG